MTDESYQKVMSEIESMTAEDIEKLSKKVTEIKPCPFCGEMPEWHQDLYDNTYCLYCNNEKCDTDMVATDHYENKEDAIKAWNKRTSPWHTGTPTEEGWYLLHYPECKEQPYELAQWNGEHFVAVKPFHAIIVRIEASNVPYWQKIEEKENNG